MPSLNFQLEQEDFELLQETNSIVVYDVQSQEQTGEFDPPLELIKTSTAALASNLKKEAQKEGLTPTSYNLEYFLILGKSETDANELAAIDFEDLILSAASELGVAEVNGETHKCFLVGVLR